MTESPLAAVVGGGVTEAPGEAEATSIRWPQRLQLVTVFRAAAGTFSFLPQ